MIEVEMPAISGVVLDTRGKYCVDNIKVTPKFTDDWVLLSDITLNENVNRISTNIDGRYKGCDTLLLIGTLNLSAADWLYCAINQLGSGSYSQKNSSFNVKSVVNCINNIWSSSGNGVFNLRSQSAGTGALESITLYTYTSGVDILKGSTLKIYGKVVGYEDV